MKTATKLNPVTIPGPIANGGIDPLITSYAQLCEVCGHDEKRIAEAVRIACICARFDAPYPFPIERAETDFARYLFARSAPRWRNRKPIVGECYTTAQLLAAHQNMDCHALCDDAQDLMQCAVIVESYNNFDARTFIQAVDRFNRRAYHNEGNCNNGLDAFKFLFGYEASPVLYIRANWYCGLKVLNDEGTHWREYTREEFKQDCREFGRASLADSCHVSEEADNFIAWRLWWD